MMTLSARYDRSRAAREPIRPGEARVDVQTACIPLQTTRELSDESIR
jgi:hypothetical protein